MTTACAGLAAEGGVSHDNSGDNCIADHIIAAVVVVATRATQSAQQHSHRTRFSRAMIDTMRKADDTVGSQAAAPMWPWPDVLWRPAGRTAKGLRDRGSCFLLLL